MQFQSVLIQQELDKDFIYSNGYRLPVLTQKMCFGKEILSRRFGNFNHNNRSSKHNGAVKINQQICVLCLNLANDTSLNQGLNGDFTFIGCEKDQLLKTEFGSYEKFEWMCDSCLDLACENSSTDQTVNEILASLPKGVEFVHSDSASVLLYFTFLSHLFPLPCGAGSTVPREGFDSSVIMPFSWCVVAVTLSI